MTKWYSERERENICGTINQIIETQVQEIINNVPKNKHGDCIEDRIEYEHFLEPPSLHWTFRFSLNSIEINKR